MIPVIFDTDPGIDDAAALAVLLDNSNFDIKMITTVAGNVSVDKTTANVLKLTHFFNRKDVAVYMGASKPLIKPYQDASNVHGKSGMPGYNFGQVTTQITANTPAYIAMYQCLKNAKEPITILTNGALTNLALLVMTYPEVLGNIKEVITMGGTLSGGNMNSLAEFNIYTDPHAAKIVLKSGLKITMIGLDVTLKALLTPDSLQAINQHPAGEMLASMINHYGDDFGALGKPMHDTNTVYYALFPKKYQTKSYYIDVITDGIGAGGLVADTLNLTGNHANVNIALAVDAKEFNEWYVSEINQIDKSKLQLGHVEF